MIDKEIKYKITPSEIKGSIDIPGSKSHTIRALICAMLADGTSFIRKPLKSSDTLSAKEMVEAFGAKIEDAADGWEVTGRSGKIIAPDKVIDIGNSGTALYLGMAIASLSDKKIIFTGDEQIQRRPADKLNSALKKLGVKIKSTGQNGCAPFEITGPLKGGTTEVEAISSQYLTALLLAAPLAEEKTIIKVPLLYEKPYIDITLSWLDRCGIVYQNNDYNEFIIEGGQQYNSFDTEIAADFSSASFFLVAGAHSKSEVLLNGLDYKDPQGDKKVVDCLQKMGARVQINPHNIKIKGPLKTGQTFDLNAMPDALPVMAVAACLAKGETALINVSQARIKETDRIAVMCAELKKMGADIEELEDGLVIRGSNLKGSDLLEGHADHRVIMALAVAAIYAKGVSIINGANAVNVTFPNFADLMQKVGARIEIINN